MNVHAKKRKDTPVNVTLDELQAESVRLDRQTQTEALEAAFQEHWPRVYRVLFRLVGDHAEAEDLALEVFWRLYRRPPADRQGLGGWLYRVATRLGFNALRAQKRREHYETEAGRAILAAEAAADPAEEVERAAERSRVRQVLRALKPRPAQALLLRSAGLSYAEIATALGVSPGSIGTLLARAERDFSREFRKAAGDR
jgi:RNA polymerase sigma-70 factor (ECF subfamily)